MNCRSTRRLLPLHVGGDLPLSEATGVEQHLASCAACRRELHSFRESRNALLAVREPGVTSSGIWAALEPRLAAVDAVHQLRRPWYRRGIAPAALAAGLLLALTPLFLRGEDSGPDSPGAAETTLVAQPSVAQPSQGAADGLVPVPADELDAWASRQAAVVLPRLRSDDPARVVAAGHGATSGRF